MHALIHPIFLLRQFFMTSPRDLDEAAMIDGASSLRILWQILTPLARPAMATVAIFSFLYHWNDFFRPLIYLNTIDKFTLSLGLRFFQISAVTHWARSSHSGLWIPAAVWGPASAMR